MSRDPHRPKNLKRALAAWIAARDGGWSCHYCGAALRPRTAKRDNPLYSGLSVATIDHVIPLSEGGSSAEDNLVLACETCNRLKSNKPAEEFKRGD